MFENIVWPKDKSLDLSAPPSLRCIDNLGWFKSLQREEEQVEKGDGDRDLVQRDETKEALIYPPNTRSPNTSAGFIGTTDNGWLRAATEDAAFLNNTTQNAEKFLALAIIAATQIRWIYVTEIIEKLSVSFVK